MNKKLTNQFSTVEELIAILSSQYGKHIMVYRHIPLCSKSMVELILIEGKENFSIKLSNALQSKFHNEAEFEVTYFCNNNFSISSIHITATYIKLSDLAQEVVSRFADMDLQRKQPPLIVNLSKRETSIVEKYGSVLFKSEIMRELDGSFYDDDDFSFCPHEVFRVLEVKWDDKGKVYVIFE